MKRHRWQPKAIPQKFEHWSAHNVFNVETQENIRRNWPTANPMPPPFFFMQTPRTRVQLPQISTKVGNDHSHYVRMLSLALIIVCPIWPEIYSMALVDLDFEFGRYTCDERFHIPFLLRHAAGAIYPYIFSPGDVYRPWWFAVGGEDKVNIVFWHSADCIFPLFVISISELKRGALQF